MYGIERHELRTAIEDARPPSTPPTTLANTYALAYDGLLRLTALTGTLIGGGTSSETFTYDPATNLRASHTYGRGGTTQGRDAS